MGLSSRWLIFGGVIGAGLAAGSVFAQAQLVYDNTSHVDNRVIYRSSHEYGDDIYLAPGYREVSKFTFQYYGDFDPVISTAAAFQVRFYANDGADALPGSQTALKPSSLLWASAVTPMLPGATIANLDVPLIDVPGEFTWTVQFSGVTGSLGNAAGLTLSDPPTIGAPLANGRFGSYWDAWIKNDPNKSDSWSLLNFGFGANDPHANFYARVEAVPEPSTWVLFSAGSALLLARSRRKRS